MKNLNRLTLSEVHDFSYFKYGNHALLIQWKKSKSLATLQQIIQIQLQIKESNVKGIIEMVPAYHSLMIYYEPTYTKYEEIITAIESFSPRKIQISKPAETIVIPVSYAEEHGPDQHSVAAQLNITREELIDIHSKSIYHVHFIGFLPGFLYLGGLSHKLNIPRRDIPRIRIPAGSVAIAAGQTGIYPVDSPGGWHIIGHTSFNLFDPESLPPCSLEPGMKVQFMPI